MSFVFKILGKRYWLWYGIRGFTTMRYINWFFTYVWYGMVCLKFLAKDIDYGMHMYGMFLHDNFAIYFGNHMKTLVILP